jgi:hypothetical protein
MSVQFSKSQVALAALAAIGTLAAVTVPQLATAQKVPGTYAAGDFHNHSTCSDGAVSLQKKVARSMNRTTESPWGLDWFVQAGHGGSGNRNCTLPEDAAFATPAFPVVSGKGPNTTWVNSGITPKGNLSGSGANQNMWRWEAIQTYQYPVLEYLAAYRSEPIFTGLESVVAGHEHTSMGVMTGQVPASVYTQTLPTTPGYTPLGNANALAQWTYCFDRGNSDTSRGNTTTQPGNVNTGIGNNWNCAVPGSANSASPDWNSAGQKLNGANGNNGHTKTVEAVKWMTAFHPDSSYYVPAHLERAGPFNPTGNNGFNVEHLRNFNNAGPRVAFGFESQPGHGASDRRGEYNIRRNSISSVNVDSVGGTTYGGTGVYAAQVGGVWDALLGEGRNWFFFANSDWHSRGAFSVDDRRSDNDFWPGEYQRNYTMVRTGGARITPQSVVDGLRTGNTWVDSGQLIDRFAFVACASYAGPGARSNASVEALAVTAAMNNTDTDVAGCATMGEKLKVRKGADIVVSIVVRDPAGKSYSPYSFPNPSLLQVGINQPLDMPEVAQIDVIRGMVTGFKTPGSADYSGTWPDNWVDMANPQQLRPLDTVPAGAKNLTAAVLKTFNKATWTNVAGKPEYKKMTFRIPAVTASQYVRVRGTNMPPAVPYETDAAGNPLADLWTNTGSIRAKTGSATEFPTNAMLRIPCTTVGSNVPDNGALFTGTGIDGCPNHLGTDASGQKMVSYDVAAWADLWFYGNPIFVEVAGSTVVAGVK